MALSLHPRIHLLGKIPSWNAQAWATLVSTKVTGGQRLNGTDRKIAFLKMIGASVSTDVELRPREGHPLGIYGSEICGKRLGAPSPHQNQPGLQVLYPYRSPKFGGLWMNIQMQLSER